MNKKTRKNLKVLVIDDMEGISGINDWHQVFYGFKEFEKGRIEITEDVNAAIRGLRDAGATEIKVVDFHGSSGPNKNVIPEKLEKGAKLFQEGPVPERLKQAADKSIAAAVFIGFHAMADTKDGFLRHTITLDPRIKINGRPVGETAFDAYQLAEYGIPAIMVSGDQALIREATAALPGIETAQVKTSSDSRTTKCLPLPKARRLIEKAAQRALLRVEDFKPLKIKKPVKLEVSFRRKEQADLCEIIPESKRTAEKTVSYTAKNWDEAYKFVRTTINLAGQFGIGALFDKLSQLKEFEKTFYEWVEDKAKEWLS